MFPSLGINFPLWVSFYAIPPPDSEPGCRGFGGRISCAPLALLFAADKGDVTAAPSASPRAANVGG